MLFDCSSSNVLFPGRRMGDAKLPSSFSLHLDRHVIDRGRGGKHNNKSVFLVSYLFKYTTKVNRCQDLTPVSGSVKLFFCFDFRMLVKKIEPNWGAF